MNRLSPLARQRLLSVVAFVGFFALWELVCMAFGVSDLILPRPSQIAAVLIEKMPLLWPHALQTLYTTFLGFALGVLAGIVVGVGIGSSKLAYDVTYPLLVGFSSIPKVAVVPLFVVWFGAGTVPAILTSMVISIFPVVVNVATGLASTEPELEDVLRVLGARKRDILWNGTVMMIASGNFDVPMVFAGLFLLAAMGIVLYALSSLVEQRVTGWSQRKTDLAMG